MTTTGITDSTPVSQRPYGRSLHDFGELKPAEKILLEACREGDLAVISDSRPDIATDDNTIRAEFLRFLLLGGDAQAPVHERGVHVYGAWIEGGLNLELTTTMSAIYCVHCTFDQPLILQRSRILGGVFLVGSTIPGIDGDGLSTEGDVFLRNGFKATGFVSLRGSQIGGDLDCDGAELNGGQSNGYEWIALSVKRTKIHGNLFLGDGFQADGRLELQGAQIGGDLDFSNVNFGPRLYCMVTASNLQVRGCFLLRRQNNSAQRGTVRFAIPTASVGVLIDDPEAWGSNLLLDGFTYSSIGDGAPTTARIRLAWLDKQKPEHSGLAGNGSDFRPQPWRQLQKVLRDMGHAEEARQVAVAFEHRMRKAGLIGQSPKTLRHWPAWTNRPRRWLYRQVACAFHWCFWLLTGYGYRPMRLVLWLFAVWLGCAFAFWYAALPGRNVFAPSNPLVFQDAFYRPCMPCDQIRETDPQAQKTAVAACKAAQTEMQAALKAQGGRFYPGNWYLCPLVREEYTGFSPLAYSLDVILPLVDLQQQRDWAPMIPTPRQAMGEEYIAFGWKHGMRLLIWFEISSFFLYSVQHLFFSLRFFEISEIIGIISKVV